MTPSRYSMDTNTHSGLDSLSSNHSRTQRGGQRSRRQSRLLYAEKYGLNSPLDEEDSGNYNGDSDQDELDNDHPHPFSMKPRSHSYSGGTMSIATLGRPRSLFNLSEPSKTTTRPPAFVKPTTATTNFGTPPCTVPNDMLTIQQLYEQYHRKMYMEGFVFKRNTYNTDGSSCQGDWTKLYVELSGPILFLWDGQKLNNVGDGGSGSGTDTILPYYINISDATATIVDHNNHNNDNDNDNDKDTDVLMMLNTAGRNQYLIRPEPPTLSAARRWVTAIRLSCFECARLYEIYTRYLLLRPNYLPLWHPTPISSPLSTKQKRRTEGYVQARFAGDTEWKKYWATCQIQRNEKRFFGKTKKVPCKSQFMFYESKKSKYPSVTIVNILYAYTLYPQSPQLIDQATMFKVEGTTMTTSDFKTGEQSMTHASAGALLMTATTNEMMKWLVGIFDVFKLYGRPSSLLDDPMDPKSLNFGEMIANAGTALSFDSVVENDDFNYNGGDDDDDNDDIPQLFLEYPDVMHLSMGQNETLLDSKMAFTHVLAEKLKNRSTTKAAAKPPLYAAKTRANSAPLLTDISTPSDYTLDQHIKTSEFISPSTSMVSISCQRPHPADIASTMLLSRSRAMVYASDDSSDDADDKLYSDQSDSGSLSINSSTPQLTATHYNKEPNTPSEPTTPSEPASMHKSTDLNESLVLGEVYQTNNNHTINSNNSNNDMMGFAKSLLSKTFGMDHPPAIIDNEKKTSCTPLEPQSLPTASPESISPKLKASHTAKNTSIEIPPTMTSAIYHKPPISKRIPVMPLASDDEESDDDGDDNKTGDDDDDEPIRNRFIKNMKITTSPSLAKRPISTVLSASSTTATANTPTTPGSIDANNQQQNGHYPYYGKMKHQSMIMHATSSSPRQQQNQSSVGLVHGIDPMQQQQQQQQQKEQQSLWETGSLMGTDPRIASYQYRLQQQQQNQQSWETGSMCGSVSGADSRMSMYGRGAGSMYGGGGSIYGNANGGSDGSVYGGYACGGSVYGNGDDYQKTAMMMMIPGQQPLLQMDKKPTEPRSGLIGVISQLEDEKREKEKNRFPSSALSPLEQQQLQQQQQQQYHDQILCQQQQLLQQQQQQQQMMMMHPMMSNLMVMNPMMMNPMMMNSMMMMQQQQQQQWTMMKNGSQFYTHQPLMEEDDDIPLARPTIRKQAPDDISTIQRQSVDRF